MSEQKSGHQKAGSLPEKKKPQDDIVEEPTEGDGGPTGSGGVASQSPSPGDPPKRHREDS